jgi:Tfp pilus assembly protein FimT
MAQSSGNPASRASGVSLVELVVAMFIAGVVISIVMSSWTFVARHTELQKRKSEFYAQTEQMGSIIANEIRTSPRVILFDASGITFVASRGGDTVTYRLNNDSLRKNGAAIPFVADGATVVKFSIEKEEMPRAPVPPGEQNETQDLTLVVTLGTQDRTGLTSEIRNRVKTRYVEAADAFEKNQWNY